MQNPSGKFEVRRTRQFEKDLKQILKRYPDFGKNIQALINTLSIDPEQGEHIGSGVFKVRINIEGKPAGDRYGARIIHAVFSIVAKVYLIRVYDKSDTKDLTLAEIKKIRKLVTAIRKDYKASR